MPVVDAEVTTERACAVCGSVEAMKGKRPDAKTCGEKCRKRLQRDADAEAERAELGLQLANGREYPYPLTEGVRAQWCATDSEEYAEFWHDAPFRTWIGACETCKAREAVKPQVDALIEQKRFELDRQTDERMKAIAPELPEYFDKTFLQEPIPAPLALEIFATCARQTRIANAAGEGVSILGLLKEAGYADMVDMQRVAIRQELAQALRDKTTAEMVAAYKAAQRRPKPLEPMVKPEPKVFTNPASSAGYWQSEVAKQDPNYKGGL